MDIATLITPLAAVALPDWRKDRRHADASKELSAAEKAAAAANERLDKAAALIIAIDAELAEAENERDAAKLEDRREAAIREEADARNAVERAQRALKRVAAKAEPLTRAARKDAARELDVIYPAQVKRVADAFERLQKEAEQLAAIRTHVLGTLGDDRTDHGFATGIVANDLAADFNSDALALVPRLHVILGRQFDKVAGWMALAKSFNVL